jgi:hypothetical protein
VTRPDRPYGRSDADDDGPRSSGGVRRTDPRVRLRTEPWSSCFFTVPYRRSTCIGTALAILTGIFWSTRHSSGSSTRPRYAVRYNRSAASTDPLRQDRSCLVMINATLPPPYRGLYTGVRARWPSRSTRRSIQPRRNDLGDDRIPWTIRHGAASETGGCDHRLATALRSVYGARRQVRDSGRYQFMVRERVWLDNEKISPVAGDSVLGRPDSRTCAENCFIDMRNWRL